MRETEKYFFLKRGDGPNKFGDLVSVHFLSFFAHIYLLTDGAEMSNLK